VSTEALNGGAPALASEPANPGAAQEHAATTNPLTDSGEGGEGSPAAPKTFTQDELNDIVRKEKARAEAKAERRVLRTLEKLQPQQQAQPRQAESDDGKPRRDQFASEDAWLDARDHWRDSQRDARARNESQVQATQKVWKEALATPGFDADAFTELTESMQPSQAKGLVEAVLELDAAGKVLAHLTNNPDEAQRIAALSPYKRAAELGKLEARLPTAPKTSKTPDPIGDPTARGNTTVQTSDLSKLPMDKYIEARKKQGARWARNH
jgi:hypothetical protein